MSLDDIKYMIVHVMYIDAFDHAIANSIF